MNRIFPKIILIAALFFNTAQVSAEVEKQEAYQAPIYTDQLQEAISYARALRKDTELSPESELLRQKSILEQFCSGLTNYAAHQSLEDVVYEFLGKELSLNKEDYKVIDASLTDIGGKSHDMVFLVRDLNGSLVYVVKAFRNPRDLSSKFLPEISALDVIEQLSMPNVEAVRPLGFALCSNQEGEWGLLLETAAKGKRLDQFVYQLAELTQGSKERETFFDVCQKAFQRMAESFVKLHEKKSSEVFTLSAEDIQKYSMRLSEVLEEPSIRQEIEKYFPLDVFSQYVESIKADALNIPLFHSYWHGDAHLGNVLYDHQEDLFYFIDVAKLHQSVSITGEPLLDGTIDLVRIEENFRRVALGLLSEAEVESLLKTFYRTYESQSGAAIPEPLYLFHKTGKKLGRLLDYVRHSGEKDPIKRAADQAIFESTLEYFKSQITGP